MDELKRIAGEGNYIEAGDDTVQYEEAWRGGFKGKAALVVFPTSTEHLAKLVKYCAKARIAIVPQGGNTGLVGGAVPDASGKQVIINMQRMNKVREVSPDKSMIVVEAGCVLQNIQEAAEAHDRFFPLSMASEGSAMLGGVVATNAGGTAVLAYGNTRELTLGVEAVLADGSIYHGLSALHKDNTGYNLNQLLIGSEGTLGIITAASIKLFPKIRQRETLFLGISDVARAIDILRHFQAQTGSQVTACELIRDEALGLVLNEIPDTRHPLNTNSSYYLLLELSLSREGDELRGWAEEAVGYSFEQGWVEDGVIAESGQQSDDFWRLRESISDAAKAAGKGLHFDISMPVWDIASFVEQADAAIKQVTESIIPVTFGHVGDGNLHYNFCLPPDTSDGDVRAIKAKLKEIIYTLLARYHGSISAEHGVGQERRADLPHVKTPEHLAMMVSIKQALDPHNIMNPGKML